MPMFDQVLAALRSRWRHVLVDEGQDTNLCQFELVTSITGPQSNLFMVGDPDQVRGRVTSQWGCRGWWRSVWLHCVVVALHDATKLGRVLRVAYVSRIIVTGESHDTHKGSGRVKQGRHQLA